MISVTILGSGTSQGVPIIGCKCEVCTSCDKRNKRLRSSVLIENETGESLVIDAGPDFRYQMLREGVTNLDSILLTHNHKDHTGGIDDVRSFNYMLRRPMDIYAEGYVLKSLKNEYHYAFAEHKYPGVPEITLHEITEAPFSIGNFNIIPIRGLHHKLPVLGYRIDNFCYITDMNHISDDEINKMKGIDTLIINALREEKHISHFTLSEALKVIELVSPKKAYLTHISHQLGLYEDVMKKLPEGVELCYDKLKIKIQ
ncbi:MAG: MBL fold metallo-hydrolase [Rikenellaceae bacterium]